MADVPEFISDEDLLVDQDPQSSIATKGLRQGADLLINSQPVQNIMSGEPLQNVYQNALSAANGDQQAQAAIANNSLGMAEGSLKDLGKISNDIKQSKALTDSKGVQTKLINGKPDFGQIIVKESKDTIGNASGVNNPTAPKKSGPPKYAEGGEVSPPEFISDAEAQPIIVNQTQNQTPISENSQKASTSENDTVPDFIPDNQFVSDEDKYGTPVEMVKTAAEGAAQGLLGPLAPAAERALGVKPEDIRLRAETNPITHGISELGGFGAGLATGSGQAKLLTKAGELVGHAAEGASLASRVGQATARGAIENALFQTGDEISKMIVNDPHTSVQTAIPEIGLSALLGASVGGGLTAISPLWKFASSNKLGQVAADFAGKIEYHLNNPEPIEAMTKELTDYYNNIKSHASEVYGANGLKSQDIARVMPEMNDKIADQAAENLNRLTEAVHDLSDDPHVRLLQREAEKYVEAIETNNPGDIFNATQDLKQQLQEWAKYDKETVSLADKPLRDKAGEIAFELRNALEDTNVWGKAGERQRDINKAFSKYLPTLKDFESKFTSKIEGVKQVVPEKIKTYLSAVGKENAATRQQMLKNFLSKSEAYQAEIANSHHNLGLQSPVVHTPLNVTMASLEKETTGGRLADAFIKKGLSEAGSKASGAAIGAGIGSAFGSAPIGALVGAHVFGPFIKSVLPALVKPLLKTEAKGVALKAAAEYGAAVAKGDEALTKAAKHVFKEGPVESKHQATDNSIKKLDKRLEELHEDPTPLENTSGDVGHYLPDHSTAAGATAASAVAFLNSLRPDRSKQSPLDMDRQPSSVEKARYTNALRVAEQPLSVFDSLKNGTLTPDDIHVLATLYPSLYNSMKSKLTNELTDAVAKKKTIPYKIKMGVSMFTGVPMDSTMLPQSIQASQMSMQMSKSQPAQGGANKPKRSTAPLSKIGEQNRTPAQAAEADQAKR